jgi:arsenite methyltransferase
VGAIFLRLQPPDSDPMTDFDERDLFTQAEKAGFHEIHLELQAWAKPRKEESWAAFLNTAGNPKIPTLAEAMQEALTPAETERFTAHLRPLVESGQGIHRMARAYLWAVR